LETTIHDTQQLIGKSDGRIVRLTSDLRPSMRNEFNHRKLATNKSKFR